MKYAMNIVSQQRRLPQAPQAWSLEAKRQVCCHNLAVAPPCPWPALHLHNIFPKQQRAISAHCEFKDTGSAGFTLQEASPPPKRSDLAVVLVEPQIPPNAGVQSFVSLCGHLATHNWDKFC